jgi:hypothetical protein
MVGDWTRGDVAIGRFLERHGRSGRTPVSLLCARRDAEALPQILTVSRLTSCADLDHFGCVMQGSKWPIHAERSVQAVPIFSGSARS